MVTYILYSICKLPHVPSLLTFCTREKIVHRKDLLLSSLGTLGFTPINDICAPICFLLPMTDTRRCVQWFGRHYMQQSRRCNVSFPTPSSAWESNKGRGNCKNSTRCILCSPPTKCHRHCCCSWIRVPPGECCWHSWLELQLYVIFHANRKKYNAVNMSTDCAVAYWDLYNYSYKSYN